MVNKLNKTADNNVRKLLDKLADHLYENTFEISLRKALSSDLAFVKVSSIPTDIALMITEAEGSLFFGEKNEDSVERCKAIPFGDWRHKYSVKTYGARMAEVVKKLGKANRSIIFENTDDDGENFDIWYKVRFNKNVTIKDAIAYVTNLEEELAGHTEILLSEGNISKHVLKNEMRFSLNVLLPLFRNMGYQDVQFNHGPREFGRDITFSDTDRLGIRRDFGVQAKGGDITGEAGSQLDKLIAQIDDALKMSYLDIYSREKRHITDLVIAISGKFTGNAPQKICEKIRNKNVHFLDIDKIQELLMKYMGKSIQ